MHELNKKRRIIPFYSMGERRYRIDCTPVTAYSRVVPDRKGGGHSAQLRLALPCHTSTLYPVQLRNSGLILAKTKPINDTLGFLPKPVMPHA